MTGPQGCGCRVCQGTTTVNWDALWNIPDELVIAFEDASLEAAHAYDGSSPITGESAYIRGGILPVLAAHEPMVRDKVAEEIAAQRDALAKVIAKWRVDEAAIRAQIAEEIEEQVLPCAQHPMPAPKPSCPRCARNDATHRAAHIARGET